MSLSNIPQGAASSRTKLFQTVFGPGVVLGTPARSGSDTNWVTSVTGTDSIAGYNFPDSLVDFLGANAYASIQSIPEVGIAAGDLTTFNSKFTNQFQETNWGKSRYSSPGNELFLQCDVRDTIGGNNPQSDFAIIIPAATAISNPLNKFYFRLDFFLPAGVNTQAGDTSTGNFWLIYDAKEGGYDELTSVGSFRYKVGVGGAGGVDRYEAIFDNNANGRGVIPSQTLPGGGSVPVEEYLRIQSDATVRTGCWHTLHVYTKRPANHLDTETGIFQVMIEPHGYPPVYLCDIRGDGIQAMGVEDLPITRLFFLNYTSCALPNPLAIANLEFWNEPPHSLSSPE